MNSGLEDVVAAETILSDVDGEAGRLIIRGYPLEVLAGRWTFEQVVHLLFGGFFGDLPDPEPLAAMLGQARVDAFDRARPMLPLLAELPVYDAMRAALAPMPDGVTLEDALRLVAAPAVLIPPCSVNLRNRTQSPQIRRAAMPTMWCGCLAAIPAVRRSTLIW